MFDKGVPEADKPNVIWILSDQHRAHALGCNGDSNVNTPNIDCLALQGVNFTGAVSGFPLCCPFRGSMLTGLYPHKCVPGHEMQLPPEQKTIADIFNENGYDTAYIGKWHLDGFHGGDYARETMHIVPPERRGGFKYWIGYENNNNQYDTWVHGGEGDSAFHYRLSGYETDELTNLFINYIKEKGKDKNKPFFAVLSVQPPHDPYVAPPEYMDHHNPAKVELRPNVPQVKWVREDAKRDLAGYYAMIENLDLNIGRVVQTLKEEGLFFNTHIMFFSDHGDMMGSHGQFRKTIPHEEAVRVPFIIGGEQVGYYNGRRTGRYNIPINHVDIAPTTLGLCGIKKPEYMNGADYSHYRLSFREKDNEPDSAYLQCVVPTGHLDSVDRAWRGIVTKDGWKYVCFQGIQWLMYNLNEDPYEQMNLAFNPRYAMERKKLNDRLRQWIEETEDRFELPEF